MGFSLLCKGCNREQKSFDLALKDICLRSLSFLSVNLVLQYL